ncbi:twin-arginine translocase TatA/TatE family subunit [Kribbella endophytica]
METLLALPEGGEWIVLLIVVVLLFGANRLPELTRNTARALVELKKITREAEQPPIPPEPSAAERAEPAAAEPPAAERPASAGPATDSSQQPPSPTN